MIPRCGLVLLTGGRGERLGGPKHDRPHPLGGSWGGHLVAVFRSAVPDGPVQIIGEPLPDYPDLPRFDDPREGPAVALQAWAASGPPPAWRWWVLACDQVRWTDKTFSSWLAEAEAVDEAWAVTVRDGHRQPLGGFIASALLPTLAHSDAKSLRALMGAMPVRELPGAGWAGDDIDTPEELAVLTREQAYPARL
ncbi:MAG TPA: NTP transferase domain-containing protein [Holophagaceae bacterium]|jgi:molybdopterin-guanine dinucleotide biosynthesis protein A|nr:NTP transferase domain-containing protein [Holophagaceae bacterium]